MVAQRSDILWTHERLTNEGSFRLACNVILADCAEAFRAGDTAALWTQLDHLDEACAQVRSEPLISKFEYTYCLVALHIGILLAGAGDFEYAFMIVSYVEGVRQYARNRRRALGLAEVHQTEVRYTLLNLLGDLKKQADKEYRDHVLTPALMWDEWKIAAVRAFDYTAPMLLDDRQQQRGLDVRTAVGWSGLQVIECCTRFMAPLEVTSMIGYFNRRLGQHLAAAPFHFRDNPPLSNSAWYWDYEIYKLDFAGKLSVAVLEELWGHRDRAIGAFALREDYDLTSFKRGAQREYEVLSRKAHLSLIDMEAKRAS